MSSVETTVLAEIWKIRGDEQDEVLNKIISTMSSSSVHKLSSGGEADRYFDFDLLTREPFNIKTLTRNFAAKVNEINDKGEIDVLGFIQKQGNTTGVLVLAGAISMETGVSNIIVRLDKDLTLERIKPNVVGNKPNPGIINGLRGVIITDYLTEAKEVTAAISALKKYGCNVKDIITFIERIDVSSPEKAALIETGIKIHHIRQAFYDKSEKELKMAG